LEGAAFYRDLKQEVRSKQQVDPRLGLGWRITPHHWLRITTQSALVDPLRTSDTLAPVAILGTVVPDRYFTAGDALSATWYHQLRWDAEWTSRWFTYVQLDRQDVEDFSLGFVPESQFVLFGNVPDGRLDTVTVGTNIWVYENVGVAANYTRLDSENRSLGPHHGRALPLIPDEQAEFSLVWVDPHHVSVSLSGHFVGERAANLATTRKLSSYWSADLDVQWEPFDKHVLVAVAAQNLLNANYELAQGFAAAGPTVVLTMQYRF
jgi:outer membrane receptor protein involved in Fe transport